MSSSNFKRKNISAWIRDESDDEGAAIKKAKSTTAITATANSTSATAGAVTSMRLNVEACSS